MCFSYDNEARKAKLYTIQYEVRYISGLHRDMVAAFALPGMLKRIRLVLRYRRQNLQQSSNIF